MAAHLDLGVLRAHLTMSNGVDNDNRRLGLLRVSSLEKLIETLQEPVSMPPPGGTA